MICLLRFLRNKNNTTRQPMTIVPPMDPTNPPISFELRDAVDPRSVDTTVEVGIATTEVIVVSG